MGSRFAVYLALFLVSLTRLAAAGQPHTSALTGVVRDSSGGAVPGALVGVINDTNLGVRGQFLFAPSDLAAINFAVDHTRQRPEGYTQVLAGVAPTLRPTNRQYDQIAADLGYTAPSFNAFDRLTDVNEELRRRVS